MFALKAAPLGEFMAPGMWIGGGKGNVSQALRGIVQSACLLACPAIGFEHELSHEEIDLERVVRSWRRAAFCL